MHFSDVAVTPWHLTEVEQAEVNTHAQPIEWWRLALSLLGPVLFLLVSYHLELGLVKKLLVGLCRSSVQLLFLGYVLLNFIFSLHSPLVVAVYIFCMIVIAALEATGRQVRTYSGHYWDSLIACLCGGGVVGIYGAIVIFHPQPWWTPSVLIPTAGMIIGNSVSGPAVAVERLLAEVTERRHETETRLALGGSGYEAVLPIIKTAIQAALLPGLNQLAIMGVVSIPGMMTGQLLGGAAPLVAAQYQMAILYLILTTNVLSTIISVLLAIRHAVFEDHRLTNKISKRADGKQDIDKALMAALISMGSAVTGFCKKSEAPRRADYEAVVEMSPLDDVEAPSPIPVEKQLPAEGQQGRVTFIVEDAVPYTSIDTPALVLRLDQVTVRSGPMALFHGAGLSLSLRAGEVVTLEGPSGIGKTRLLRAIAQLDPFLLGDASYGTCTVRHASEGAAAAKGSRTVLGIPAWRERIIYVPQALPPLAGSPKDLVKESCRYACRRQESGAQILLQDVEKECDRLEEALRLRTGLLSEPWAGLSGGERQRAAIACALLIATARPRHTICTNPLDEGTWGNVHEAVLLLDEPTAACDPQSALAVEQVLQAAGVAIIMTTHDDRQALRVANRRILLKTVQSVSTTAL